MYDISGFDNSLEIIEDFYVRYPNKPQLEQEQESEKGIYLLEKFRILTRG